MNEILRILRDKAWAADFFSVTTRTIDAWMAAGTLPYLKIGKTVRFDPRDLEAFLEEHKRNRNCVAKI